MRMFRIIGRSITTSWRSIFRNFSLSMASITCTMITLVLVAVGILLSYNIRSIAENIENELTMVIFLERDIEEEAIGKFESGLKNIDNVDTVTFKSKTEAREDCIAAGGDMAMMCEIYGEEALQDSFIITVFKADDMNDVHVELTVEGGGITIYSKAAAEKDMGFNFDKYHGTGMTKFGFSVKDTDAEYERLKALNLNIEFVAVPTTYSWGPASVMHFRDLDGNIVCFGNW